MNQSGIFRIGVLKKIGKMKTIFCTDQLLRIRKYYSKNGAKKLRGIKSVAITILTWENGEFSSLNEFGHQEIDLYPKSACDPIFQY
jgi:hypothetical protein